MGPWNIPKYTLKKKNGSLGKGNYKMNEGNNQNDGNIRGTKKPRGDQEVKAITDITLVVVQEPKTQEANEPQVTLNATSLSNRLKVRNPLGGKNPQVQTKGRGVTKPGKGMKCCHQRSC